MKVLIIANECQWASWPAKVSAIHAFFAPLIDLQIDIKYTGFTSIPTKQYPGTVTQFSASGAVDVPGLDTELDQEWFNANIGPLIDGYDIAVFQTTSPNGGGLPLGVKFEQLGETWCCETFVTEETDNYYLPGVNGGMGGELGNSAEVIIEHEISHALYSMSGQTDNTHLYFYGNQFARVLTDIKLPNQSAITSLYQQVIKDLEEELGIIKANQSAADMNGENSATAGAPVAATPPAFPAKVLAWARVVTTEEGSFPLSHNPGNLKYSSLTASWGATKGNAAADGGFLCHFSSDEQGFNALCNFLVLGCEDELVAFHAPEARTLAGFTKIYAGNPPEGYITAIEKGVGVTGDTLISTFLA